MELVEQERNTERAGHTGTKEATVGASSSGALTRRDRGLSQAAFELVLAESFPRVCEREAWLWEIGC